jgi:hypothetical protein
MDGNLIGINASLYLTMPYCLTLRTAPEKKRGFTTNLTNLTNKAGISDKKFVFFVRLVSG